MWPCCSLNFNLILVYYKWNIGLPADNGLDNKQLCINIVQRRWLIPKINALFVLARWQIQLWFGQFDIPKALSCMRVALMWGSLKESGPRYHLMDRRLSHLSFALKFTWLLLYFKLSLVWICGKIEKYIRRERKKKSLWYAQLCNSCIDILNACVFIQWLCV